DRAGVALVEVSDVSQPRILGRVNTPGQAVDVASLGRIAYVADWEGGLSVIDFSDPAVPEDLAFLYPPGDVVKACTIDSRRLFVSTRDGIDQWDLTNPRAPRRIAPRFREIAPAKVAADGEIAFAASDYSVIALDLADPSMPTVPGTVLLP